jgi:hypothetical protein
MTRKYDIKYAFRKYESQGVQKTFWTTHGTLWVDDTGKMRIKMDSSPIVGTYDGWFQVFEQQTQEQREQRTQTKTYPLPNDDEDVPF